MNASWNGRHFGLRCAAGSPPFRIASRCRAARATASFIARKASRACASVRSSSTPAAIRSRAGRAETIRRFAVACRGAPAMAGIPASWLAIQVS